MFSRSLTSIARQSIPRLSPSISTLPAFRPTFRHISTSTDDTTLHPDNKTPPSSSSEPFKVSLHPEYFQTHRCDPPSLEVELTKEKLIWMYTKMVEMRRMEMAADNLYKSKLIRGFCHLAIGQVSEINFGRIEMILFKIFGWGSSFRKPFQLEWNQLVSVFLISEIVPR
jgi:hypothetical protein